VTNYEVEVRIMPRKGLLDPQGSSIRHALRSLGFRELADARVGKTVHLELEAEDVAAAEQAAAAMCRKLLANPVTESFAVVECRELEG